MRIETLTISNFMRFKHATINLHDRGVILIEGVNKDDASATSNGAGKSTVIDALLWCLYGITTHEPSGEGDDVVREGKINCEVSLTFKLDEDSYKVTRRRAWHKGGKLVQLALCHRIDLSKGTIKDTQEEIVKLLGMSAATFRFSCVFGQGRAYRFSRRR